MKREILNNVNSPEDLKALDADKIEPLCEEIRSFLIESVEKNGGHLASNLGVTELSVALHRVFDSPSDHIIFDVGHQSYIHKLLTGRRGKFSTLRKPGGLSGFTKMSESSHDAFGAGHSSTAVSAALGYAEADRLCGKDSYTVAVVGDGAYTGGMVHEALNNCDPDLKLIIILNENGMSVSMNKGAFARYLSGVRISKGYVEWKKSTNSVLKHVPIIGRLLKALLTFVKTKIKDLFFASNYFEDLGLYYIGPIDGNNYKKLEKTLIRAKNLGKCVVVHIKTVKGKGYTPAESSPEGYHSIVGGVSADEKSFHSAFGEKLIKVAENNEKVVAVTAAMGTGTGLSAFEAAYPDRYFDVGIAEEHAVTFAAGIAAQGMTPFVAVYSTFLQRAYDSVLHDVALQGLSVKLMIDRASLALSDGATHHGIFDVAFLSHIPEMTIISPATYTALEAAIDYAAAHTGPIAVRYPNKSESECVVREFYQSEDKELLFKKNFDIAPDFVYITYGTVAENVVSAAEILKGKGIKVGIVLLELLKPYDFLAEKLIDTIKDCKKTVFVEEGIRNGGAGMILYDSLRKLGFSGEYDIVAIDDNFASPDTVCDLYDYVGLSAEKIAERML